MEVTSVPRCESYDGRRKTSWMGLLGALLTFAPQALYAAHAVAPLSWGLTPLGDQQLGGLIMWVPAMLPYLVIIDHLARRSWGRAGASETLRAAGGEAG